MEIMIKVQGLEEAINAAKRFPGTADRMIDVTMGRAASMGMTWMYPDTPVGNTMGLRNSLFSRQNSPSSMEIGATSPYAVFVHQGTRPHEILPVRAQALRFRVGGLHGPFIFAKRVWHPGTKPNPFVKRTVDKLIRFIRVEFLDRMKVFMNL